MELTDALHLDLREAVLPYLRGCCNSFATMSANAEFSDDRRFKTSYSIQVTDQKLCCDCNNSVVSKLYLYCT